LVGWLVGPVLATVATFGRGSEPEIRVRAAQEGERIRQRSHRGRQTTYNFLDREQQQPLAKTLLRVSLHVSVKYLAIGGQVRS